MILEAIAQQAPALLLIFARTFALLRVAPITNSSSIPSVARVALAMLAALVVYPNVEPYQQLPSGLEYGLLMVGEILLGILTALFLVVMFAVFQLAGQFFSLQMGFGASQVFDPMAQVEIPVVGQFLNMLALMIFVFSDGMQRIFLAGVVGSFEALRAVDIASAQGDLFPVITGSLAMLFEQALVLSLPILGTLFLLQATIGLFGKAAPQMNLLLLGFPAAIGLAFLIILLTLPLMVEAFEVVIDTTFDQIALVFARSAP